MRSSILSVAQGPHGLPDALHTAQISVTRRGDGGHTLAISGRASVDPTPQLFRFAREFVPMFAKRWRSLVPGGLQAWHAEQGTLARWRLDAPTPMERTRILDPRPDRRLIRETHRRAYHLLPALQQVKISVHFCGPSNSHKQRASAGFPGNCKRAAQSCWTTALHAWCASKAKVFCQSV